MSLTARARSSGETEKFISDSNDVTIRTGAASSTSGRLIGYDNNLQFNTSTKDSKRSHYMTDRSNSCIRLIHFLRHYWALLPFRSRLAHGLVCLFFVQHVVLGMWDILFQRMGKDGAFLQTGNVSLHSSTTFAVAINTYKRPKMLREAVVHYAEKCGKEIGIDQVFVIWAEQNAPVVPEPSSFFEESSSMTRGGSGKTNSIANRADVYVLQKEKDSLNSRFESISQLKSEAVFMVDDDLRVSCSSLKHGFEAWRTYPNAMVGYYPRLASYMPTSPSKFVYHTWPVVFLRHKFNFVLTKASFMHSKYLDLYSGKSYPWEIRDHVDQHMNCEDVAMSLLVANHTKYESSLAIGGEGSPAIPIYVEGHVSDKGLFGGISTGGGHMSTRSECLTRLSAILEAKGWGSPLRYEVSLGRYSWLHHSPGFWWQSRPSNFFEWLSIGNILSAFL